MNLDPEIIKEILNLGGVFALAVVVLFVFYKKMDSIENNMIKLLTLMSVLIKETTKFNHIDNVLDEQADKVHQELKRSGVDV